MDARATVRGYYRAIDEDHYDRLRELLAADFVQRRPDRTFEGREAFVAFMREGRPVTDTTHEVDGLYADEAATGIAARGRLLDGATELFRFVDVHRLEDGRIAELATYTR